MEKRVRVHTSASATRTRLSLIFLLTKGTTTKCIAHPPSTTATTTTIATTPEGESENEGAEGEEEGSEGISVDESSEEKSLSLLLFTPLSFYLSRRGCKCFRAEAFLREFFVSDLRKERQRAVAIAVAQETTQTVQISTKTCPSWRWV
jgi:hypothetical protein